MPVAFEERGFFIANTAKEENSERDRATLVGGGRQEEEEEKGLFKLRMRRTVNNENARAQV